MSRIISTHLSPVPWAPVPVGAEGVSLWPRHMAPTVLPLVLPTLKLSTHVPLRVAARSFMLLRVFESQLAAKCSPSCSFLSLGRIQVYVLISAVGPGGVGWETLPRLLRKKLLWESEWKTQGSSLAFFLCLSQYPARGLVCSGYPRISGELCYGSAVWFSAWGSSPCRRGTVWRQSFSQCPRHSHSCSVSGGEPQPLCA